MTTKAAAPGKINLYLDVLEPRADGYHEIQTVFAPLRAPEDMVTVAPAGTGCIEIRCSHPAVPTDERNLCWRAAKAFARVTGIAPSWCITLDKRIPVAAGLGGGSSDAASTLRLLNRVCGRPLSERDLAAIGRDLGADVPFFLEPVLALACGIGDRITPLETPISIPLVLLNPGFPVSAAWAYAHHADVTRPQPTPTDGLVHALAVDDTDAVARHTYNALEYAVCRKFPIVEMMLEFLLARGCSAAHVCGSGPTVYGICPQAAHAAVMQAARETFGPRTWLCSSAAIGRPEITRPSA